MQNSNKSIIPIASYYNVDKNRCIILNENRRKSGIYRWNNLITGKSYVGSSISLSNRFRIYYSLIELKRRLNTSKSAIHSALLKHGHANFSLDIL